MATATPVTALVLSAGSVLAWQPFGIQIETISVGMVFAASGMFGRFAFDMQKAVEAGDTQKKASVALKWVAYGLLGAPFITTVWLVLLRLVGVQTDLITVGGLLLLGFTGPKGITAMLPALWNLIGQHLPKGAAPPPAE